MTTAEAIASYQGCTCPLCHGHKPQRFSVCQYCWDHLHAESQRLLSQPVNLPYTTRLAWLINQRLRGNKPPSVTTHARNF